MELKELKSKALYSHMSKKLTIVLSFKHHLIGPTYIRLKRGAFEHSNIKYLTFESNLIDLEDHFGDHNIQNIYFNSMNTHGHEFQYVIDVRTFSKKDYCFTIDNQKFNFTKNFTNLELSSKNYTYTGLKIKYGMNINIFVKSTVKRIGFNVFDNIRVSSIEFEEGITEFLATFVDYWSGMEVILPSTIKNFKYNEKITLASNSPLINTSHIITSSDGKTLISTGSGDAIPSTVETLSSCSVEIVDPVIPKEIKYIMENAFTEDTKFITFEDGSQIQYIRNQKFKEKIMIKNLPPSLSDISLDMLINYTSNITFAPGRKADNNVYYIVNNGLRVAIGVEKTSVESIEFDCDVLIQACVDVLDKNKLKEVKFTGRSQTSTGIYVNFTGFLFLSCKAPVLQMYHRNMFSDTFIAAPLDISANPKTIIQSDSLPSTVTNIYVGNDTIPFTFYKQSPLIHVPYYSNFTPENFGGMSLIYDIGAPNKTPEEEIREYMSNQQSNQQNQIQKQNITVQFSVAFTLTAVISFVLYFIYFWFVLPISQLGNSDSDNESINAEKDDDIAHGIYVFEKEI